MTALEHSNAIVIVGASHSGVAAAAELRSLGCTRPIVLIGEEEGAPYHRPHLSKECLSSDMPAPAPLRAADFYGKRDISHRGGMRVTAVDRARRRVTCADGEEIAYGDLILATGAGASQLPATVDPRGRVVTLRHAIDWARVRQAFEQQSSLVVVGGGLIGLEAAAAACARGIAVTVVEAGDRLMARSIYPELAAEVLRRHQDAGVTILLSQSLNRVEADGVMLASGVRIAGDLVLAAIGSRPHADLAQAAGLAVADGIVVDPQGRTGDLHIYALGDCAAWRRHDGSIIRHESIAATHWQARCVAAAITGQAPPQDAPFKLWSTQGSMRLQMSGPVVAGASTHLEAVAGGMLLRAFQDKRLIAVQAIDAPRSFNAEVGRIGALESEFDEAALASSEARI